MADSPRPGKVSNRLAAIIIGSVSVCCLLLVTLALSQPVNLWRIEKWIAKNDEAWSRFVDENPKANEVRFFGYTGGNGMLGVNLGGIDKETEALVREFISVHNPPRPAYYIRPVRAPNP